MNQQDDKKILLAFNPNDFFYYNANQTPNENECNNLLNNNSLNCNDNNFFINNSDICIKQNLCNNKLKAQTLLQTQTISTVDVRLKDMNDIYDLEKTNCINYSLGISIISIMILNKIFKYFNT